jgi:hypothetical protein
MPGYKSSYEQNFKEAASYQGERVTLLFWISGAEPDSVRRNTMLHVEQ